MVSAAQIKATTKYIKEKTRRYVVQCNRQYDADIIEHLEGKPNVAGYIKELIRKDMRQIKKCNIYNKEGRRAPAMCETE